MGEGGQANDLIQQFVELAGGKEAKIVVIPEMPSFYLLRTGDKYDLKNGEVIEKYPFVKKTSLAPIPKPA